MSSLSTPSVSNISFGPLVVGPAWLEVMLQAATKAASLATTSTQVVAMRLSMLAVGGNTEKNRKEVEGMFTEKMSAVNESAAVLMQLSATMAQALPTALIDPKAAERMLTKAAHAGNNALTPFANRVTANHKRLSR